MNEICPHCHEPQRFPVDCMDTVVYCQKCAKQFLCSRRERDEPPRWTPSDRQIRNFLTIIFWGGCIIAWLVLEFVIRGF